MGRPLIDITGYKIGRLEVLATFRKNKRTYCRCICECGNEFETRADSIQETGETRSCGCLLNDMKTGKVKVNVKHNESNTKLYRTWDGIKKRCHNKKHDQYRFYGALGIEVCEEWRNDYKAFSDWAKAHGYVEGLSIERLDNSKGYSPDNCTWIEFSDQGRNKRSNVYLEVNGEMLYIAEIATKYKLAEGTVRSRYKRGLRGSDLIKPVIKKTPR